MMFGLFSSKKKVEEFKSDKTKAYLALSGKKITIDGKKLSEYEWIKDTNANPLVKLNGGLHEISGVYESYGVKSGQTKVNLDLKPGSYYMIGLWQYTPEYIKENIKKKCICYVPMSGAIKQWGLICFEEE